MIPCFSYSQLPKDSIQRALHKIKSDTAKVNFLNTIFLQYKAEDESLAIEYLYKSIELSKKSNYLIGYAIALKHKGKYEIENENYDTALVSFQRSLEQYKLIKKASKYPYLYNDIGLTYIRKGDYVLAEENLLKGIELAKEQQNNDILSALYYNLGEAFRMRSMLDEALENFNKCLFICTDLKDTACISSSYDNIGSIYAVNGNYLKALEYFNKDIELNYLLNDKVAIAHKYNNVAMVYVYQGNYPKALDNYLKSLELRLEIGDKQNIAFSYNNIGEVYSVQNDPSTAIEYFRKSLVIYEVLGDKIGIANTHLAFGKMYHKLDDYNVAISSYNRSILLYEELNLQNKLAENLLFLGESHAKINNIKEALDNFNKALEIAKSNENERILNLVNKELSRLYLHLNQYSKAIKYATQAYSWGRENGEKMLLMNTTEVLAEAYAEIGNHKKAYKFHKIFKQESDSILYEDNIKEIAAYGYQFIYEKEIEIQELENIKRAELDREILKRKQIKMQALIIGFILLSFIALNIFRIARIKRKANEALRKLNKEILLQKDAISANRDEIQMQKNLIDQKNKILEHKNTEILDSVRYASKIQAALLPSEESLKEHFRDFFIYFKPRDIVSGDFYWFKKIDNKIIIAAADCTGHGVPGALMSMLGVSFLSDITSRIDGLNTGDILNQLRDQIKKSLKQTGKKDEAKDGIDVALCTIDFDKNKLEFSGAYNSMLIVRQSNNEVDIFELKGDRQPAAIHVKEVTFTVKEFNLQENDIIYLFSDGYIDQFGGKEGKKFKLKNFKNLLLKIHNEPLEEQAKAIDKKLIQWIGEDDQLDDILVIGLKYE